MFAYWYQFFSSALRRRARPRVVSADIAIFPPTLADLVDKVKPGVVNISTTTTVRVPGNPFRHFFGPDDQGPFSDFFRTHYGDVPDRELKQRSLGSGFIIDKEGYIITNNHVVEKADEITVRVSGKEYKATIIGRDPKTDLALIKLATRSKTSSHSLLAIQTKSAWETGSSPSGTPLGSKRRSRKGIISATGRVIGAGPYDNFLQTDAPINPGNSGGPLLNLRGEVIGINTAIVATGQGIGFAIPINTAKLITSQLKDKGKVTRGWVGVTLQSITPEIAQNLGLKDTTGVLVADVVPGGPAEKAGIERGDVITAFDGKEVKNTSDLSRLVAETPIGKTVTVRATAKRQAAGRDPQGWRNAFRGCRVGPAAAPGRADLGMTVDNIAQKYQRQFQLKDRSGVVVVSCGRGGMAEQAGIQAGDIIKEINRFSVRNLNDYRTIRQAGQERRIPAPFDKAGRQQLLCNGDTAVGENNRLR